MKKHGSLLQVRDSLFILILIALWMTSCSSGGAGNSIKNLSEDEKHRLYSAALASSESPLETDTFKQVCQQIGIYDSAGKPNEQYMTFVSQHVDWSMKSEPNQFRREIDSKEKAQRYIKQHLPTR